MIVNLKNMTLGQRQWIGDPRVLRESRKFYEHNPREGLLPHASNLYGQLIWPGVKEELLALHDQLIGRGDELMVRSEFPEYGVWRAQLCVTSTILEWMSRQKTLGNVSKRDAFVFAENLCKLFRRSPSWRAIDVVHHEHVEINLTFTLIELQHGVYSSARDIAEKMSERAPSIIHKNQRSRAYRKLGIVFRKLGDSKAAHYWGREALRVPGIPPMVWAKGAAALLGIVL
jgi:hypothetical protein